MEIQMFDYEWSDEIWELMKQSADSSQSQIYFSNSNLDQK